jgi:hypothetical protein
VVDQPLIHPPPHTRTHKFPPHKPPRTQWHVKYAFQYTAQGLIDPHATYWAEILPGATMNIAYKIKGRFPPTVYFSWQVRCCRFAVFLCGGGSRSIDRVDFVYRLDRAYFSFALLAGWYINLSIDLAPIWVSPFFVCLPPTGKVNRRACFPSPLSTHTCRCTTRCSQGSRHRAPQITSSRYGRE